MSILRESLSNPYGGWTAEEHTTAGRAMRRVYAGWAFGQVSYRKRVYENVLGFPGHGNSWGCRKVSLTRLLGIRLR